LILVSPYSNVHSKNLVLEWIAPAPTDAWWRSCTISYSFGTPRL